MSIKCSQENYLECNRGVGVLFVPSDSDLYLIFIIVFEIILIYNRYCCGYSDIRQLVYKVINLI